MVRSRRSNLGQGSAGGRLVAAARRLERERGGGKRSIRVPALFFMTDPERTPDPDAVLQRLPQGCGVIARGFARPNFEEQARALRLEARRRGHLFLIGADSLLAARLRADGVHLPERDLWRARGLRHRFPAWILTGAAHSHRGLRRARDLGLDAVFLSVVFPSNSPSARGRPLGPVRLALLVRASRTHPHALGGITSATAGRLGRTGVAGFAAVEALAKPAPPPAAV